MANQQQPVRKFRLPFFAFVVCQHSRIIRVRRIHRRNGFCTETKKIRAGRVVCNLTWFWLASFIGNHLRREIYIETKIKSKKKKQRNAKKKHQLKRMMRKRTHADVSKINVGIGLATNLSYHCHTLPYPYSKQTYERTAWRYKPANGGGHS